MKLNNQQITLIEQAISEDLGSGDITASLLDDSITASAKLLVKEQAVLCGTAWFDHVFKHIDSSVVLNWRYKDGDKLDSHQIVCEISGNAKAILTAERTALNFLQTLSGTATITSDMAEVLQGTSCRLLDTRKTLPGYRLAQKYAVRCGGGFNHRIGLYDAYLIKENHIRSSGGITAVIEKARKQNPDKTLEIEVESINELKEAIEAGADIVMLDNFSLVDIQQAVELNQNQVKLEISGNVEKSHLKQLAQTGVDYISSGALTKHIRAIDFSLLFDSV